MTYAAPADVTAAAFGADGRAFACLTGSGSVAWWPRIADGGPARVLTASADPDDRPTSLALSRDGTTVAVGLSGGTILVWDAATGRRLGTLKAPAAEAVDLAFGPDGHTLASAGPQAVRLWDTGLGVPRTELSGGRQTPASAKGKPAPETHPALAFLPHGRTLATGRAGTGLDLWNADTGRLVGSLPLQSDPLWHVVAAPAGSAVATVDSGGHVRLWDLRTRRVRLLGALAADAAFSPDGRTLATVLPSGHLRLWDTASGALRKEADVGDGDDTLYTSLAYSPDGHTLAARDSDGNATLVNPDADGTLRVLSTGPVAHHDLATAAYGSLIAFSPDGRTLAVLGRGPDTLVWDVPSGRLEATLQADAGSVTSLAFSPDGRSLVVGGSDGTARVWDMSGHRVRAGYTAGTEPVTSVALSPDGDAVATRSGDGTTHVWSAHLPDGPAAVQEICAAVHRDLTPRERQRFTPRGAPAHPCPASRG
jgi:WD40 repeat protein